MSNWTSSGISDNDLDTLHGLVGTALEDADLEDAYDRLGSIYLVAQEVLRGRLNTFLSSAAQFSIPGAYSENNAANIAGLEKQLDELNVTITKLGLAPASAVTAVNLCRRSLRR